MPVKQFLLLALTLTWLAWLPAALLDGGATTTSGRVLHWVGGAGPLLALVVALARSGSERKLFVERLRVGSIWSRYGLAAVLLPIAFGVAAWTVQILLTGRPPAWPSAGELAALALPVLLFGALPEELAWRGYALPHLLDAWSPLSASLALGAVWALWHVPLFFIEGTHQAGLGVGSIEAVLFSGTLLIDSIVMTWLFQHTRSVWGAVAYHWMTSLVGAALDLPFEAALARALLALLFATGLAVSGALRPRVQT
jgi:membrane protease YdiL (CAAX protease family)